MLGIREIYFGADPDPDPAPFFVTLRMQKIYFSYFYNLL